MADDDYIIPDRQIISELLTLEKSLIASGSRIAAAVCKDAATRISALSLPVSNTDIDRTSEPKGHWQDGGKVWVEDHDCCLPVSNTGEWQPIETAPKDGLVDIWIDNGDGTGVRWCDCYHDRICDEWRTSRPSGRLLSIKARHVTHWRPLPEAPK